MRLASAQEGSIVVPKTIEAGNAFSIQIGGSGSATLYIVGPEQVLKRNVQRGGIALFPAGSLSNAGCYTVILAGTLATETASFSVLPESVPASISFLAKPSRLPVAAHDGITGAAYVFDADRNLIERPTPVTFELTSPAGAVQTRTEETHDGAAWTAMDSTSESGNDKFVARAGNVAIARVIRQVPGDPCGLTMSVQPSGRQLQLQTNPVRDCSGNEVADGTIVTFTEMYDGGQSTADVPLKHGVAKTAMPAHDGATLSVASGVVMGNQIHWEE
ncbi:MAG: hypothetical protein WBE72_18090 [Terracidiphilus sp.]